MGALLEPGTAEPGTAESGTAEPGAAEPGAGRPVEREAKGRPALASRPELAALAARTRPAALAAEDVLAADEALAGLLGGPGLRRGWTVVVDGAPGAGSTSLLLRLLAAPSTSGAWCALVGLPGLGVVAAEELGVALDRLLVVPEPGARFAGVVAALLEGCDVVAARPPEGLAPREAVRLAARARERRSVLIVAAPSVGRLLERSPTRPAAPWPGEPDVRLEVVSGSWVGIGDGQGRLLANRAEIVARRRRGAPGARRRPLWLQEPPPTLDGTEGVGGGALPGDAGAVVCSPAGRQAAG